MLHFKLGTVVADISKVNGYKLYPAVARSKVGSSSESSGYARRMEFARLQHEKLRSLQLAPYKMDVAVSCGFSRPYESF